MCFDEKNLDTKECFVSRAIEKRVRNKRRRDPDMYVDVLLSSTVKRLKYELVNDIVERRPESKREISHIPKKKDIIPSNESPQKDLPEESEVKKAVECLQSTLESLDAEIRKESLTAAGTIATHTMASTEFSTANSKEYSKTNNSDSCADIAENKESNSQSKTKNESLDVSGINEEDVDFDTLMQSLLEICEPLNGNVDDLMKEYSIDPLSSGTFDFLSSSDPFLPGMFEVMCS